jgi:hypothetical protein
VAGAFPADQLAPRGAHPARAAAGAEAADDWRGLETARLPWDVALSHLAVRVLDGREAAELAHGRAPRSRGEGGLVRLMDAAGGLLGVAGGAPAGLPLVLRCVLSGEGADG